MLSIYSYLKFYNTHMNEISSSQDKYSHIGKDSLAAWMLAMRLYSIPLSVMPVIAATALAYKLDSFNLIPALLCIVFATLMHIVVNLSNDYYDFKKGADAPDRDGFARLVSGGLLDAGKVLRVTAGICTLACAIGMLLVFYGGWWLIPVGLLCVVGAYGYTAGPYPLAYHALGDVTVFIFFGLIVSLFSFYVQALEFHYAAWILGILFGLTVVNILTVNNIRDVEEDRKVNKITTVVLFGTKFGKYFYLINGLVASLLCLVYLRERWYFAAILPQIFLILHLRTWRRLSILTGSDLDGVLKETVRNVALLGGLVTVGLLV